MKLAIAALWSKSGIYGHLSLKIFIWAGCGGGCVGGYAGLQQKRNYTRNPLFLYPTIKRSPQVSEPLIRLLRTGEVYIVTQMKPTRLAQTVWIENGLTISSIRLVKCNAPTTGMVIVFM